MSVEAETAVAWIGPASSELRFRQWEDDPLSVVYNPLSGDTHLLDPLLVELLSLLSGQAKTVSDLLADLGDVFSTTPADDAHAMIEHGLARLHDMGLALAQRSSNPL